MASCSTPTKGFLTRLLHNEAGNTLAIVAAAIFPLAGMIGGGLDMSRLYLAKTRLQQACDAGALAGRKAMGSGSWSTTKGDDAAKEMRSEEHTSELQSLMRSSYAVFWLTKKTTNKEVQKS